MKSFMPHVLVLGALVAFLPATVQAEEASLTLTVDVDGAEPGKGQVIVTLFDHADHYMKKPAAEKIVAVDHAGAARVTFDGLATGTYAVSVLHDRDSDGKLDTNFLGIPKEKFGFSNNARARFGPPPFEEAHFALNPETTAITVSLEHAKK